MENNYAIQFPEIMKGKKILYVHGFSSSGQSGTVVKIREMLPGATVVAPDLPLHPAEAMDLLHHTCETENPDLIIGTSMGGMYAEMLYGYDRIDRHTVQVAVSGISGNLTFVNRFAFS